MLYFHSLSVISDMAVGGLMAYLALNSVRFKTFFRDLPRAAILALYLAGAAMFLWREHIFVGALLQSLQRLAISLFFAFVLLEQNYSRHSWWKMGHYKLVSKLGTYTYGLYLLHPIAITLLQGVAQVLHWPENTAAQIALGVAGLLFSLVLSVFSYHGFEAKFLKLKRRFTYVPSAHTLTQ